MSETGRPSSLQIARHLSQLWAVLSGGDLASYVLDVFGLRIRSRVILSHLLIGEEEGGDFEKLLLGGSGLRNYWAVNEGGIHENCGGTSTLDMGCDVFDVPSVRFFFDGALLIVAETLGPKLMLRRLHQIEMRRPRLCVGPCLKHRFVMAGDRSLRMGSPTTRDWPGWGSTPPNSESGTIRC